jgi:anaerobic selenocysteine-containing dehydrogenase
LRRIGKLDSERVIDTLLRLGPYGDRFLPWSQGLNLAKVRAAEHGIDLGPLVPMRERRVTTPDKLVELAPRVLADDVGRVKAWIADARARGLVLIGRRHVRSNNSWMHNVHSLTKGPDRSTLLMHPTDAARLDTANGSRVRIASRVGEVTATVEITSDIMPGVVSLPHGFGHGAAADTMRVAGALPGASANAITDDMLLEPLTGTAVLNGVPVRVERLAKTDHVGGTSTAADEATSAE